MDGVGDKACSIRVPIFLRMETEAKAPESNRIFIRITGCKGVESMQIAGKGNEKGCEKTSEN